MQRIGKYEIISLLGQGGMGAVYKGRDAIIGRDVAIKVIHERALNAPSIKQRFYREARSAGRLSHENITVIYDVDEQDGTPFLVMEYLEGRDLREMLSAGGALSNDDKLAIAVQICQGLRYAHEQGIVHRDIKPENIRVLPNGRVKIMDFGIARIQNETQALTQTNLSLGTPRYMAPEQIKGQKLDRRADIFSFGVLFYELLTGNNPFVGDHVTTVIYKILHTDPEPIHIVPGSLSEDLQPIVQRCLAKDPDDRYQDFSAVLADMHPIVTRMDQTMAVQQDRTMTLAVPSASAETIQQPLPSPSGGPRPGVPHAATPAAEPKTTARKGRWAALSLVLALSLAGIGYLVFRPSGATTDTVPAPNTHTEADTTPDTSATAQTLDAAPIDTLTDAAILPAPESVPPETTTDDAAPDPNQQAAEQARRAMERIRQRVAARSDDPDVTARYQRAEQNRQTGNRRYDAGAYTEALSSFQSARDLFDEVEQALAQKDEAPATAQAQTTQPPAEPEEPPREEQPASTGTQTEADRARTRMHEVQSRVAASQRQTAPYEQALSLEIQGDEAYEARAFDQAAAYYAEAAAQFEQAAATSTPEAKARAAIQALARRLETSIEQEDARTMQNVFFRDWSQFFNIASDVSANVQTSNIQVDGSSASVNVRLEIAYRDNKNQPQDAVASYTWILEHQDEDWIIVRVPSN